MLSPARASPLAIVAGLAFSISHAHADERLARARALLHEGDLDSAAALAEQAIGSDPGDGSAHLVLGLARFAAARFDEALHAFADARASERPPPLGLLTFNVASAQFELGRYAEAEQSYLRAAAEAGFAAIATVNAGHAALAVGALDRARNYARAAAALPDAESVRASLRDLRDAITEAEARAADARALAAVTSARQARRRGDDGAAIAIYRNAIAAAEHDAVAPDVRAELHSALGDALYDDGRYADALRAFATARDLAPHEGAFVYRAARAELKTEDRNAARADFTRALALGLERDTARRARDALDGLDSGLRAQGPGVALRAAVTSGYDSNVSQLGPLRTEVIGAEVPTDRESPFVTATADVSVGERFGDRGFVQGAYLLDQIAYTNPDSDLFSLQAHALNARGEYEIGAWHFGLGLGAEYQLSGLTNFAPFQRIYGVEPVIGFDEGANASTWLLLRLQDKQALDTGLDYFSGQRTELLLSQKLRIVGVRATLSYRHRNEDIGVRDINLGTLRPTLVGFYHVPYSYRSDAALLAATVKLGAGWRLGVDGSYERLRYDEDNVLRTQGGTATTRETTNELARVRRRDRRFGAGARLTCPLADLFEIALRYDVVINESSLRFKFDDKRFTKHTVVLELSIDL